MSSPLYVTAASGAYANFLPINATLIPNFSSYQNIYEEYRILGVTVECRGIRAWADSGAGYNWTGQLLKCYMDEDDAAVPTSTAAIQHRGWLVSANPNSPYSRITAHWKPEDLLDLHFIPIGTTSTTPVRFKMYTNTTDFGGNAGDSVTRWWVQATVQLEFRGVGGS